VSHDSAFFPLTLTKFCISRYDRDFYINLA